MRRDGSSDKLFWCSSFMWANKALMGKALSVLVFYLQCKTTLSQVLVTICKLPLQMLTYQHSKAYLQLSCVSGTIASLLKICLHYLQICLLII